ncbi:MAG: hypothetical protein ACRC35_13260 [Angustibacter sp.]
MPSVQDVADQINNKLDEIVVNTASTVAVATDIRTETQTLNGKVDTLDGHLQSGLSNLAVGLFAVWEVEKAQLVEQRHHTQQNDTVICLLENANELLCGITRKLTTQLELSRGLLESTRRLEGIAERAEPAAAGDYDRLQEIEHRIEVCCPPERPEPEPCPQPCPVPRHDPYQPHGQDWKPQPQPDPIG